MNSLTIGQQQQQSQVWQAKVLTALRSYQSLSTAVQAEETQQYAIVAPTLVLERLRIRAYWFAEIFPVPLNAKYLQYVTRDINVRLQDLVGQPNRDVPFRLVSSCHLRHIKGVAFVT
jgi:hypothetical protein